MPKEQDERCFSRYTHHDTSSESYKTLPRARPPTQDTPPSQNRAVTKSQKHPLPPPNVVVPPRNQEEGQEIIARLERIIRSGIPKQPPRDFQRGSEEMMVAEKKKRPSKRADESMVVKEQQKDKAPRMQSAYDVSTIATDVLRALGKHPTQPPLNAHRPELDPRTRSHG